jgi:hypothetical protein
LPPNRNARTAAKPKLKNAGHVWRRLSDEARGTKNLNTMHIRKIWRRLSTTRHARTLEAELALERAVIVRLDSAIAQQGVQIDQQSAEISQQGIEIARLRAENRALLNSILGIAGVPPLPATEADLATLQVSPLSGTGVRRKAALGNDACAPSLSRNPSDLGSGVASHQMNARGQAEACPTEDSPPTRARNHSGPHANQTPHVAAPTRRRSWPQIHRLLEFESAQKEKPATDPLPPARV